MILQNLLQSVSGEMDPKYCNVFLYTSISVLIAFIISILGIFTKLLSNKKSTNKNAKKMPNYNIYTFIVLIIGTLFPYIINRLLYTMCMKSLS